jgi:hypothetical protein
LNLFRGFDLRFEKQLSAVRVNARKRCLFQGFVNHDFFTLKVFDRAVIGVFESSNVLHPFQPRVDQVEQVSLS